MKFFLLFLFIGVISMSVTHGQYYSEEELEAAGRILDQALAADIERQMSYDEVRGNSSDKGSSFLSTAIAMLVLIWLVETETKGRKWRKKIWWERKGRKWRKMVGW